MKSPRPNQLSLLPRPKARRFMPQRVTGSSLATNLNLPIHSLLRMRRRTRHLPQNPAYRAQTDREARNGARQAVAQV